MSDAPLPSPPDREPSSVSRPSERTTMHTAMEAAKRVLQRRFRVLLLVRDAYTRMSDHASALKGMQHDLRLLLQMMSAWARRSYQRVPWSVLLLTTGAVIYFVAPVDLIPDALIGIGFVDDVAVVSMVVRAVRKELDRFETWAERQSLSPGAASDVHSAS